MRSIIATVAVFLVLMLVTLVLVGWLKRLSIQYNWFDMPTRRGSHHDPIPNIGGLAMSAVLFCAIIALVVLEKVTFHEAFVWLFSVSILGIVGFLDDIRDLSTLLRIVVHMMVGVVVVQVCGGINRVNLGFMVIEFDYFSAVLGFIWVVGFINMYNFMDGINGLAGCQALISGLCFSFWFYLFGQPGEAMILLSIAAVSAGFLYWNLTPSRVFMGDSGSTMLGGAFAIACLELHNSQQLPILFPALIFTWFLLDTSITLIKRLLKGEKIWQAHRQHFYQKLAVKPKDHIKVTGMISLLTLIISLIITMLLYQQSYV